MNAPLQNNQMIELIERYKHDRLNFVSQVLGAKPEKWQAKALRALDNGEEKISIRSGHGVGKTAFLAWCMLHYLLHYYPCKIILTAPSSSQLDDAALPEMRTWAARLPKIYGDQIDAKSDKIYLKAAPFEAFVSARTARVENPEALQGIHADNVLIVVDEASGVPEPIYESAQGSLSTKGSIVLLTSNPTKRSGFFYDTQTKWSDDWFTMKVSCFDSGQVDPSFIDGMKRRYKENSSVYAVRVLGEFPPAEDDTFIPFYLVDDAMHRDGEPDPIQVYTWGVDPARFGDDRSVLCKRQGHYIHPFKAWVKLDTMQLASRVFIEYETAPYDIRPYEIFVDSIGIGAGVADRLRQLMREKGYPCEVIDVNVSESATMGTTYHRLRDELWGRIREALETRKMLLPDDDDLLQELITPKMTFSQMGKIILESKDKLRARGVRSPDMADALALSFAGEAAIAQGLVVPENRYDQTHNIEQSWIL